MKKRSKNFRYTNFWEYKFEAGNSNSKINALKYIQMQS
jgi:hypothetical protein